MRSGKTGNKATASSVSHRLISTIECELNHGLAVPLCVTVLGIALPGWRSFNPVGDSRDPFRPGGGGGGSRRSLVRLAAREPVFSVAPRDRPSQN